MKMNSLVLSFLPAWVSADGCSVGRCHHGRRRHREAWRRGRRRAGWNRPGVPLLQGSGAGAGAKKQACPVIM